MIAITVLVNGVARQAYIRPNTLHVQDNLTSRNTFSFDFWDQNLDASLRPVVGYSVLAYEIDGITKLFAGSVDSVDENFITGAKFNYIVYTVHCVDYNQICDRFLVAETYINPLQTLSTIVNDINTNVLTGEGISTARVQTGPVIPETKIFNYKTVTQVFNELQTLTNYVWWIDYDKVLNWVPRTGTPSAFSFDASNVISMMVTTSRASGPYRNRQYVRAGTAETAPRTEILTGDGKRKSYNTTYEIERGPVKGNPPTILLNGTSQTVGLHGVDTGFQFYWTRGANQVVIDDTGTPLSSSDQLTVTYIGRYPSVVQAQLDAEISARKVIEGGTGVYESLKTDRNLNDLVAQQNLAKSLLNRYGFIPQQVKIVTDVVGVRSGMLTMLNFPVNNVVGNYLVQSIAGNDVAGTFMRYLITLVNG